MGSTPEHSPSTQTILQTRRATVVLVCLVAALSYIAPLLQSALMRNLTDGMAALPGLRDFGSGVDVGTDKTLASPHTRVLSLFDLRVGVPVASIAWFIPADTIEVLIAATGLRFCFGRAPRLNHINSVAKYKLFAVLLAPCVAAFVSARGIPGDYWTSWRISFLSEVLAFITLPPAILSWASEGPAWLSAREGRETSPARQRVVGAQLRR